MDKQKLTYFPDLTTRAHYDGGYVRHFAETHIRICRDGKWYAQKLQVGKMSRRMNTTLRGHITYFNADDAKKEVMLRAHIALFKSHDGVDLDQEIEGNKFWTLDPCQLDEEDRIKEILQTI